MRGDFQVGEWRVRPELDEIESDGERVAPQEEGARGPGGARPAAGGLLLLVALGAIELRLALRETPSPAAARWGSPPRLAVLPLRNLQADEAERFFADGVTEALITELAQLRGLEVIARTSVLRFEDSEEPTSEIARQLGVGVLIEGAVARSGDRVRVTVRLIEGASESHLWAEQYDRPLADVLEHQRDLAHSIAAPDMVPGNP